MVQCVAPLSPETVTTAFLAAPNYIARQILDLTLKQPNFQMDVPAMEQMPHGTGSSIEQIVFRGSMPEIERGLAAWASQGDNAGCDPCAGPNCSYHWTEFPASAWERKKAVLAERQFRTPAYCVKDIQTTRDFETVFGKIIENMYKQTRFFKSVNVNQNVQQSLTKKYVVDSGGPKANTENPYVYRPIGSVTLSALNITLLEFFYEYMSRSDATEPYDMVDGAPIFALQASRQLISHMYRDDSSLRQDARFSGAANNLLSKYNFQSTIRGMFIPAPIQYPRRFNVDSGVLVEVLPLVNGVIAESGFYTGPNPLYELATHEEVLIHGRDPFKLVWRPTVESLGSNTSFGPEPGFMDYWQWINPQTIQDPFRRVGYFATAISLGVLPQYSEGMYGIVVARPGIGLTAVFNPVPTCPPTAPTCSNEVAAVGCPCPLILGVTANPVTAGEYFFTLAVPLDSAIEPEDTVQVGTNTGGYVVATVVAISSDRLSFSATLAGDVVPDNCTFVSLFCDNTMGCYSDVIAYAPTSDVQNMSLTLENPIKADTAADVVTVYFGDGTSTTTPTVVSVDMVNNVWVIDFGATFVDNVGGIVGICVPTATDASCPACGFGPTVTQCTEE